MPTPRRGRVSAEEPITAREMRQKGETRSCCATRLCAHRYLQVLGVLPYGTHQHWADLSEPAIRSLRPVSCFNMAETGGPIDPRKSTGCSDYAAQP